MEFIPMLCLFVSLTALAVGVAVVYKKVISASEITRLLEEAPKNDALVYKLLCCKFPRKHIMRNVFFPIGSADSSRAPIDILLVCRAGVIVIKIVNGGGHINNPSDGDWCRFNEGRAFPFRNPFEQNRSAIKAIFRILRKQHLVNVPAYNITVFTNESVKLRHRNQHIVKPSKLIDFIGEINKNRFLTTSEVNTVIDTLRSARIPLAEIKRTENLIAGDFKYQ